MTSPQPSSPFQLTLGYQVPLALADTDAQGNPVSPSTPPVWQASDSTVQLTPAANGLSCVMASVAVGATPGSVTAVTTNPDGTTTTATFAYQVVADDATQSTITAGQPVPITPSGATAGTPGAAVASAAAKLQVK